MTNPREIIESIPTSTLLQDTEDSLTKTPAERGFCVSKVLQRGAMVCLASTIPLFIVRNHDAQMTYPLYAQSEIQSIEPLKATPPNKPPLIDMSTLQDAVSGLGFVLDPPSSKSDYVSPLPAPSILISIPPSGASRAIRG